MSSPQTNLRRRARHQSPFKVPTSSSIFLQSLHEKEEKKVKISEFLALPIVEKTSRATRVIGKQRKDLAAQLEEINEECDDGEDDDAAKNVKPAKPTKMKIVPPKQTAARRELKMAMMKQENLTRDRKHDLMMMERQKAVLELSLLAKRSEIVKMDKAIAKEEKELTELEASIKKDNLFFEECLKEHEKKSVAARTFFEHEAKSKQEKMKEIKRLTAEIVTIRSDLEKIEDTLINYNRYKELLLKLSPPEWREAQRVKAVNAKALEGATSTPAEDESSIRKLLTDSSQEIDALECEEGEPELYFNDPQQLVDLLTELTEQNLSLIQNTARVEETLEEVRQAMEITRKKIEQDEEYLTLQINDIKQRIDTEKTRGTKLKQKVQLHVSLNTEDEDIMLDALGEKVSDVYHCCVDGRMTNLNTLEKLANIENSMSVLLQSLESIPEENLELMKKIKDSERRTREREEKLIEQRNKQKERMQRYLERSLADSKKIVARRLMPRCIPVTQKVKVANVENVPAEDELQTFLFTSDDME